MESQIRTKFDQPYNDEGADYHSPNDLKSFLTSLLLEVVGRTIDAALNVIISGSVEERIEEKYASDDAEAWPQTKASSAGTERRG